MKPKQKPAITKKFILLYSLAFLGAWAALLAQTSAGLAIWTTHIDEANRNETLALILGIGAVFALIANPLFGYLSDRSRSRLGRRRPFILFGAWGGFALLCLMPLFDNVLWSIIIWSLVQLVYNAGLSALGAVIADQVPAKSRGVVSATISIGASVGIFVGVGLVSLFFANPLLMFGAPALLGLVLMTLFALTMKDEHIKGKKAKFNLAKIFIFNPFHQGDYTKSLLSRLFLFTAIFMVTNFQINFMQDALGWDEARAARMVSLTFAVATAFGIFGNAISGFFADRTHKYKIWVNIFGLLMAASIGLLVFNWEMPIFITVMAIIGTAQGVFLTVSYAISTFVLPTKADIGKWMGIVNISSMLPQSLAPAIAPLFLLIGESGNNYHALFIAAASFALLGTLLNQTIKKVR
ncbi:MFS transporter [Candidatus Saccharibacteria bacterium]|nr:MFS transporter [Candidatus Saccharibacteria bacterium]